MKKILFIIAIGLFANQLKSAMIDLINIPTAEVVDYGVGEINVRLYHSGGMVTRIIFAPFNRFNFGGSLDIEKIISKDTPTIRDPQFYFKWRVFDGTKNFPALALGYDGQGYEFSSVLNRYTLPAKGIFLTFTLNIFVSGLFTDFGVNLVKYGQENKTFGFFGLRYMVEEMLAFMVEYENIGNNNDVKKLNAGLRFTVSEYLNIDFVFKNIPLDTETEFNRQIKVSYCYKFF